MKSSEKFPRLLVMANCCLSNSTSNGRTLKNFLVGWPKNKIAQFCVRFDDPDFSVCDNYYHISDRNALKAFCFRGAKNGVVIPEKQDSKNEGKNVDCRKTDEKKIERNAFSAFMREIIWSSKRWRGKFFDEWLNDFLPEVILLQAGDSGFMFRLSIEISKKYNIPIVVYNSEAYYFKDFDYMCSKGWTKIFSPIFKRRFRNDFERLMAKTKCAIYCCDMLTDDYREKFDTCGVTIYTATNVAPCDKTHLPNHPFKISYLGNLGVGRPQGLVNIAQALQSISRDLKLDVYGKIPNESVKAIFDSCSGINYKGFVSYEKVKQVMCESDVLVHTENFNDYYRVDLKYAFSTKIADSLASGTCFLLYAPEEIAAYKYLDQHDGAYVVNNEEQLKKALEDLVNNPESRNKYLQNAKKLVDENHNADKNSLVFQKILIDAVYGEQS